ncbi:Mediator of RNA polymerase II transcription subunit 37f [Hibiscus syriacus]|uniref:Mediator of RNA polymerase II transcription subunit 37f n=1 Tax=Hibiscus syriacus TaxID=106335 RepID=A0A6A2YAR2_HIBSY|nr:Mediator of RNA polymerase II transcription subunit 37f [Hibiscus syriacus]
MAGSWRAIGSLVVLAIVLTGEMLFAISIAKEEATKLGTVIGIDLGNRITPSWVAFTDSERLIGEAEKNQAAVNAERTIFDVKRLIGRNFEDKEVQRDMKLVPYKIVNKDGKPYIQVKIKDGDTKVFSPEEISAMVLTKMKETAEAFLGKKIKDAVVTVPDVFSVLAHLRESSAGVFSGENGVCAAGTIEGFAGGNITDEAVDCNVDGLRWVGAVELEKLKEVEAVCNPIITAVYQRSGGAPGGGSTEEDDSHDEL